MYARLVPRRQLSTILERPAPYNSVRLELPPALSSAALTSHLAALEPSWRAAGRTSIWVRVPMAQGELLPPLHAAGFRFHHALDDAAELTRWLPATASKVPPLATHQMGCAGVVLDVTPSGEPLLLTVRENRPVSAAGGLRAALWKFPGGLADAGEDIGQAAAREVLEETGVRSSFAAILAFRHTHGAGFGGKVSDLYVLTLCTPLPVPRDSDGRIPLSIDPHEIAEARWESPWAYIQHSRHPINTYVAALALQAVGARRSDLTRPGGLPVVTDAATLLGLQAGPEGAVPWVVQEDVYIPITKSVVKAYRVDGGPSFPIMK
jgi:8-oxo-dGTP pyrophosphatase MutT (NUDIX family)